MEQQLMITIFTSLFTILATIIIQKLLANTLSGVGILLFKPFKKGDKVTITFRGFEIASGHILHVGLVRTKIKTYDRDVQIISNSLLDECVVINSDYKMGVNKVERICVSVDSDLEAVESIINKSLIEADYTNNTSDNTHIVVRYDAEKICVQYNVRTNTTDESFDACSNICKQIVKLMNENPNIKLI